MERNYTRGEDVEVMSKEDGYKGSYYEAVVISQVMDDFTGNKDNRYIVQYRTLQTDDTKYIGPLREFCTQHEIRPLPPQIDEPIFHVQDKIDAYYNDGWWMGRIHDIKGSQYVIYFDYTDEFFNFMIDDLRPHQDWVDNQWVTSRKRGRPKKKSGSFTKKNREISS